MSATRLRRSMLACATLAAAGLLCPTHGTAATLFTYSFIACNFESGCPHPTTILTFETNGPVTAPPLNSSGLYSSSPAPIAVVADLAGSWTGAYIESYRNIYNQTGSFFLFDHLVPANGNNYGTVVGVDAFVAGPTTNPLQWDPGTYTGLIAFECNYGLACPSTSGANESVHVLVTAAAEAVPEPGSAWLLLASVLLTWCVATARRPMRWLGR